MPTLNLIERILFLCKSRTRHSGFAATKSLDFALMSSHGVQLSPNWFKWITEISFFLLVNGLGMSHDLVLNKTDGKEFMKKSS